MSLAKRLHRQALTDPTSRDTVADDLRRDIHNQLIVALGTVASADELPEATLREQVRRQLKNLMAQTPSALPAADREQLIQDVVDDVTGYGPIDRYIRDPSVSEVMVNGPTEVFIEREGRISPVPANFIDETHLRRIIDKIVSRVGRRVDESTPMVDARLPDGSRVNVVTQPLSVGGPFLTIRKFARDPLGIEDLIRFGSLSRPAATFLETCVRGRLNVVVSGGSGTGKTTLLNVLSGWFADHERIITIEDAKELQLRQRHVLPMETRPPNIEGRGEVTVRDLVRNALRMRPDRIVVGEVRGGEALDMLQAMNSGHDGSLTSVHANTAHDALARIETMTLMSGLELPLRAIRDQIASAVDLVVHTVRQRDGTRLIMNITEVVAVVDNELVTGDVFAFRPQAKPSPDAPADGGLRPTSRRPRALEKLLERGVDLPDELFTALGQARPARRAAPA
ncbi:MAG TPA: CpaF family protein [Acidimicrobiales bacterium]|nr:CpaF family protein [Acidimicrobiales bacterium]